MAQHGLSLLTDGDLPKADVVVVFGAPWIRPPLLDWCLSRRALNLHAGVAPEYRGTACNFWAQYDQHPELVGYTIHYLDQGLDTGPIIERVSNPRDAWSDRVLAPREPSVIRRREAAVRRAPRAATRRARARAMTSSR